MFIYHPGPDNRLLKKPKLTKKTVQLLEFPAAGGAVDLLSRWQPFPGVCPSMRRSWGLEVLGILTC